MRREGSPCTGSGSSFLKELSDHLTSARMRVLEWLVVLIALAALYGAIQQIRDVTAEDPFLFLRAVHDVARAAAVVRVVPELPGSADRDRAGLRRGQRRAQPAHAVAHPGAADLSRRAAVRKIHRRAVHALDQPGRAVAAGDRAWACCCSACRRAPRRWRARFIFLLVTIAYAGVWLALAMLFSIIFRSAATAALVTLGLWLFLTLDLAGAGARDRGRVRAVRRRGDADPGGADICRGCRRARCSARSCWRCSTRPRASLGPIYLEPAPGRGDGRAAAARREPDDRLAADRRPGRRARSCCSSSAMSSSSARKCAPDRALRSSSRLYGERGGTAGRLVFI